jgi:Ca-activated chloride channel family protein
MRFAQPIYLYGLLALPLLWLFLLWASHRKKKAREAFGNLDLIARLSSSVSTAKRRWKVALLFVGILLLVVAAARPQLGTRLMMMKRQGLDLVIALDTSASMLTEDIKPNRLEKAKQEIRSLIDKLEGDRVGLVVFAGEAFVQSPLTLDYGAAKMFLEIMDERSVPVPGTAIAAAINTSVGAFNQKERKYKVLILITDGEDHEGDLEAAAEAAAREGIRVYTIGVGSPAGEPIPIRGADGEMQGFKKDRNGSVVLSKLDEVALQKIALSTGGKYYRATYGEMELDKIYDEVAGMEKRELASRLMTQYEDRFQYPLFLAVLCFALEAFLTDRRRIPERGSTVNEA